MPVICPSSPSQAELVVAVLPPTPFVQLPGYLADVTPGSVLGCSSSNWWNAEP